MGALTVEPKANQDMIDGYVDGRDLNAPAPSNNRSRSYHHGFAVGRAERENKSLGSYEQVTAMADEAMRLDYLDQNRMLA